jgi:hypothetical protein
MKQRLEATHFIEIFKDLIIYDTNKNNSLFYTPPIPINYLKEWIEKSVKYSYKTIAVWNIKYK